MFKKEIIDKLNVPLSPDNVKTRKKAGINLSYISGFQVEQRANEIFDYIWSKESKSLELLFERPYTKDDGTKMFEVAYKATVKIIVPTDNGVIFREGTGAGNGQAQNLFDCHELAIKEAETDATKRAFKTFGDQFGLSLYDKDIDVRKEYETSKSLDLEFREKCDEINSNSDIEALRTMYKSYNGAYKTEILELIIARLKVLRKEAKQ